MRDACATNHTARSGAVTAFGAPQLPTTLTANINAAGAAYKLVPSPFAAHHHSFEGGDCSCGVSPSSELEEEPFSELGSFSSLMKLTRTVMSSICMPNTAHADSVCELSQAPHVESNAGLQLLGIPQGGPPQASHS